MCTPPEAIARLGEFKKNAVGHIFWPDEITITDEDLFAGELLTHGKDLTDLYLLGLAARRQGRLATFDRRLRPEPIRRASRDLIELIDANV